LLSGKSERSSFPAKRGVAERFPLFPLCDRRERSRQARCRFVRQVETERFPLSVTACLLSPNGP